LKLRRAAGSGGKKKGPFCRKRTPTYAGEKSAAPGKGRKTEITGKGGAGCRRVEKLFSKKGLGLMVKKEIFFSGRKKKEFLPDGEGG